MVSNVPIRDIVEATITAHKVSVFSYGKTTSDRVLLICCAIGIVVVRCVAKTIASVHFGSTRSLSGGSPS